MSEFYHSNGVPKRCSTCNGTSFYDIIHGTAGDHIPAEIETFCTWCDASVAYWAYGQYSIINEC